MHKALIWVEFLAIETRPKRIVEEDFLGYCTSKHRETKTQHLGVKKQVGIKQANRTIHLMTGKKEEIMTTAMGGR